MSIIKKAAELPPSTTLVMGSSGSGKSTVVRDEILRSKGWKALWVAFSNTAALQAPETGDAEVWGKDVGEWAVAVPDTWAEFNTEIVVPAVKGEFKEYNTLVLDGLNVAAALSLGSLSSGKQATQQDWGIASGNIRDSIVKLRGQFDRVFITVDVVTDDAGARKTALNPYLHNLIVPLCGNKWFTYVSPKRNAEKQVIGLDYAVQRNSAMALNFTPNTIK